MRDAEGNTSLHYATYVGDLHTVELLIDCGGDIKAKNNKGLNLLHCASKGDNP